MKREVLDWDCVHSSLSLLITDSDFTSWSFSVCCVFGGSGSEQPPDVGTGSWGTEEGDGYTCAEQPLPDSHVSGASVLPSNRCRGFGSKSPEVLGGSGPMGLKVLGSQVPVRVWPVSSHRDRAASTAAASSASAFSSPCVNTWEIFLGFSFLNWDSYRCITCTLKLWVKH